MDRGLAESVQNDYYHTPPSLVSTKQKLGYGVGQELSTSATKDSRHELDLPQIQTVANLTALHIHYKLNQQQ